MHDDDDAQDDRLRALFARPDPTPDPAFVDRIARAVRADQAFRAARSAAWRRFRGEASATLAATAVFAGLWWAAPAGADPKVLTLGPAAAAAMLMALWLGVGMRSSDA